MGLLDWQEESDDNYPNFDAFSNSYHSSSKEHRSGSISSTSSTSSQDSNGPVSGRNGCVTTLVTPAGGPGPRAKLQLTPSPHSAPDSILRPHFIPPQRRPHLPRANPALAPLGGNLLTTLINLFLRALPRRNDTLSIFLVTTMSFKMPSPKSAGAKSV